MQKQKLVYEVPQTDVLVVRFEESVLTAGSPGGAGGDDDVIKDPTDY